MSRRVSELRELANISARSTFNTHLAQRLVLEMHGKRFVAVVAMLASCPVEPGDFRGFVRVPGCRGRGDRGLRLEPEILVARTGLGAGMCRSRMRAKVRTTDRGPAHRGDICIGSDGEHVAREPIARICSSVRFPDAVAAGKQILDGATG